MGIAFWPLVAVQCVGGGVVLATFSLLLLCKYANSVRQVRAKAGARRLVCTSTTGAERVLGGLCTHAHLARNDFSDFSKSKMAFLSYTASGTCTPVRCSSTRARNGSAVSTSSVTVGKKRP